MRQNIERSATFLTHLGAGPLCDRVLERALARAPILIAVDGGVAHAARVGRKPARIIGDLDGQPADLPAEFADVPRTLIAEQDSTDFDKALRSTEFSLSLSVGFLGGRVDHELACFHTLAVHCDRRVILLSDTDAVTLLPPQGRLHLPPATRVSLFPLARVTLTTDGLRWPLSAEMLDPLQRVGTSNETVSDVVSFKASGPGCLLITPVETLDALIQMREQSPLWSRSPA